MCHGKEAEVKEDGDDGIQESSPVEDQSHQVLLLSHLCPLVVLNRLDVSIDLLELLSCGSLGLEKLSSNQNTNKNKIIKRVVGLKPNLCVFQRDLHSCPSSVTP